MNEDHQSYLQLKEMQVEVSNLLVKRQLLNKLIDSVSLQLKAGLNHSDTWCQAAQHFINNVGSLEMERQKPLTQQL